MPSSGRLLAIFEWGWRYSSVSLLTSVYISHVSFHFSVSLEVFFYYYYLAREVHFPIFNLQLQHFKEATVGDKTFTRVRWIQIVTVIPKENPIFPLSLIKFRFTEYQQIYTIKWTGVKNNWSTITPHWAHNIIFYTLLFLWLVILTSDFMTSLFFHWLDLNWKKKTFAHFIYRICFMVSVSC